MGLNVLGVSNFENRSTFAEVITIFRHSVCLTTATQRVVARTRAFIYERLYTQREPFDASSFTATTGVHAVSERLSRMLM